MNNTTDTTDQTLPNMTDAAIAKSANEKRVIRISHRNLTAWTDTQWNAVEREIAALEMAENL